MFNLFKNKISEKEKILKKWSKKLTNLSPEKLSSLYDNSMTEMINNGKLDHETFKALYAKELPSVDAAMELKIKILCDIKNKALAEIDILYPKLKLDPDNQELKKQHDFQQSKIDYATYEIQHLWKQ